MSPIILSGAPVTAAPRTFGAALAMIAFGVVLRDHMQVERAH
jgi:hypothetical protein